MSDEENKTSSPGGLPDHAEPASQTGAPAEAGPSVGRARGPKKEKKPRTLMRSLIEIVVIVAAAFALAMLVQAFIVKPFTIHQVSMEPTLHEGDRVLISRLSYHFHQPKAGDVVVLHSPMNVKEDLVKRIVAVADDTVAIHDGRSVRQWNGGSRALLERAGLPGRVSGDYDPQGAGLRDGGQSQQQRG